MTPEERAAWRDLLRELVGIKGRPVKLGELIQYAIQKSEEERPKQRLRKCGLCWNLFSVEVVLTEDHRKTHTLQASPEVVQQEKEIVELETLRQSDSPGVRQIREVKELESLYRKETE